MKIKWTIVAAGDTSKPINTESWRLAPTFAAARLGIQLWLRDSMPAFANAPSWRHVEGVNRTLIDFGSKLYFGLIVREK